MNLYEFVKKYGTHSASVTLRAHAKQLADTYDAHGYKVDVAVVEEMAKGLEEALTLFVAANGPAEF